MTKKKLLNSQNEMIFPNPKGIELLRWWTAAALCFCLLGGSNSKLVFEGQVITKKDLVRSIMGTRIDIGPAEKVLPGSKVSLSFDKENRIPIKGTQVITDIDGKYKIDVTNIGPPKNRDGYFFLIVEKEDYESLVDAINVGRWAHFMRNTVKWTP